jgi:protein TonB
MWATRQQHSSVEKIWAARRHVYYYSAMPKLSALTLFRSFVALALVLTAASVPLSTSAQNAPNAAPAVHSIDVNWSVMHAMLLSRVQPRYPQDAKEKHITGVVTLEVLVSGEGNVDSTKPLNGPEELRQAAIECVQQWKFRPYLLNGKPIQVRTEIPIYFMISK